MQLRSFVISLMLVFTMTSVLAQSTQLQLANDELEQLADSLHYGATDILSPIITDHYTSQGITHIYFQQAVEQIGIYGTSAAVHLKNDQVYASNLHFLKGLAKRAIKKQFQIQAIEAVAQLALAKGYPLSQTEVIILETDNNAPSKPTLISESGISKRTIPLQLLFIENDNQDLQLVWSIFIDEVEGDSYKNFLVNASTGAIEKELNLTISCEFGHTHPSDDAIHQITTPNRLSELLEIHKTKNAQMTNSYAVFPLPCENPYCGTNSVGNQTTVTSPWNANTTASPNGWHRIGSTNYTTTRGNNVDAYEDSDNTGEPTGGDAARSNGGANLIFDDNVDLNQAPTNYKPAAITNLFYWSNIIHDVWYNYGFDEPSGNFQEENFGRGGFGSDYVYAEAQDGSGTCNANMSTPSDGSNPRMQMYVCEGRDGDFDNGVIVHEYGHGISIRLTGGPASSSCLYNTEQMGEGWSDWFGTVMTIQPDDNALTTRPMGTWLFGQSPSGGGIRPYPYSTDMNVNPMTYATIANDNISVPHGLGSVWATMLWDLTWAMISKHGWDADLYNGNGGNNKTMALVILGLKLQPCAPGFVDGRDAILAADRMLYGGDNQFLIWEVFARRGLGYSADQGSSNDRKDGTEAFDMPPNFTISLEKTADKTDANLGEAITYTIRATNNLEQTLNDLVFTDFLPSHLEFVSASHNGQANQQTITWPAISLSTNQSAERTLVAKVRDDLEAVDTIFMDDLEEGTANWAVTTITGDATWNHQTNRFNSGSYAYFSPGHHTTSTTNLTTATFHGVTEESELVFQHFYNMETGIQVFSNGQRDTFGWDAGKLLISINDGVSWEDLGDKITQNGYTMPFYYGGNGFSGFTDGWIETRVDLSSYVGKNVKIRFQALYDYSVFREGWYIDDIKITNLGLSLVNQVQIGNANIVSSAEVTQPTKIIFDYCATNITTPNAVDGSIPPENYRSENQITSSGIVKTGTSVGFYAGNAIILNNGFQAEIGSSFIAKIENCAKNGGETSAIIAKNERPLPLQVPSEKIPQNRLSIRPNPFSDQAIIEYEQHSAGHLWIGLHDITGKVVKVLVNENQQTTGHFQVILDNEYLQSGAYWLSMRSKEGLLTQKVFLLK